MTKEKYTFIMNFLYFKISFVYQYTNINDWKLNPCCISTPHNIPLPVALKTIIALMTLRLLNSHPFLLVCEPQSARPPNSSWSVSE